VEEKRKRSWEHGVNGGPRSTRRFESPLFKVLKSLQIVGCFSVYAEGDKGASGDICGGEVGRKRGKGVGNTELTEDHGVHGDLNRHCSRF